MRGVELTLDHEQALTIRALANKTTHTALLDDDSVTVRAERKP